MSHITIYLKTLYFAVTLFFRNRYLFSMLLLEISYFIRIKQCIIYYHDLLKYLFLLVVGIISGNYVSVK